MSNKHQLFANPRPVNMEMSLLSWLALLTFYMLYILLGGCMFNHIEDQKDLGDSEEEAVVRSEIKGPCTYDVHKFIGISDPPPPCPNYFHRDHTTLLTAVQFWLPPSPLLRTSYVHVPKGILHI